MRTGPTGGFASTGPDAHLPGKHDQSSHGRKKKSRGRTPEQFDAAVAAAASGKTAQKLAKFRAANDEIGDAVREYGSIGATVINDTLRRLKGRTPEGPDERFSRRVTEGMDGAMSHQSLARDIVVRRGVKDLQATLGGRKPTVGMEWTDHGFGSTSTRNEPYGITGITNGGGQLRILAPRGTRAISGENLDPGEVVLDRGLRYRAVRVSEPDDYGVQHLDVEVLND